MTILNLLKSVLLLMLVLCGASTLVPAAQAQAEPSQLEAGIDYNFVRANGPPGGCGCFSMNGANARASVRLAGGFSAVGEFGGEFSSDVNGTGEDLTLYSYLFGPRYTVRKWERWQPFAQLLVGGAHASGTFEPSVSGTSGSYNAFAMVAGGGLDINLTKRIGIRAVEADYYLTLFPNGVNGHQNNLRIAAGVYFRF
jgi:peptidoglycan-associated lipoprotein